MNKLVSLLFFIIGLTSFSDVVIAQCADYGSKDCVKYLDDYHPNGQINTASLLPGESAKVQMIFYRGHDYRLVFCSEEHLGELAIKVMTSKGDVLFDNSEHDMDTHWDFSMKATQRFIIEVTSTNPDEEELMEGCVAISVGVRPSVKKGFN